jgi:hypothetical protein
MLVPTFISVKAEEDDGINMEYVTTLVRKLSKIGENNERGVCYGTEGERDAAEVINQEMAKLNLAKIPGGKEYMHEINGKWDDERVSTEWSLRITYIPKPGNPDRNPTTKIIPRWEMFPFPDNEPENETIISSKKIVCDEQSKEYEGTNPAPEIVLIPINLWFPFNLSDRVVWWANKGCKAFIAYDNFFGQHNETLFMFPGRLDTIPSIQRTIQYQVSPLMVPWEEKSTKRFYPGNGT